MCRSWITKSVRNISEVQQMIGVPPTNWFRPTYIKEIKLRDPFLISKAHFSPVLYGVDPDFPKFMWYKQLGQIELTINHLRQATLNPRISAQEYFNGAFDYASTPLSPIGCKIFIHTKPNNCKYLYQRVHEGFSVGPELHHYHFIQAIDSRTKSFLITYTAEYLHVHLTQPT